MESLQTATAYRQAALLYTRVFGYTGTEFGLNANLLSALRKSGGSTIGAFQQDGELIGFSYGFEGTDGHGQSFHYSQATAVDARFQSRGIGYALKMRQRDIALGWGQTAMRWTFDPFLTRNAHFNFSSLRAEGIRYEADFYDRPDSDRIVVSWRLDRVDDPYAAHRARTAPMTLAGRAGEVADAGGNDLWIAVPRVSGPRHEIDARTRAQVRSELTAALEGRSLVACAPVDDTTSAYLAVQTDREEAR